MDEVLVGLIGDSVQIVIEMPQEYPIMLGEYDVPHGGQYIKTIIHNWDELRAYASRNYDEYFVVGVIKAERVEVK